MLHTEDKRTCVHEDKKGRVCAESLSAFREAMINLSPTVIKTIISSCFTFCSGKQETAREFCLDVTRTFDKPKVFG